MNLILSSPRTASTVTMKLLEQTGLEPVERHHYGVWDSETQRVLFSTGQTDPHTCKHLTATNPIDVVNLIYIKRNIIDQAFSEVVHEKLANLNDSIKTFARKDIDQYLKVFCNSAEFLIKVNDVLVLNLCRTYMLFDKWPNQNTKKWTLNYDDIVNDPETYISNIAKILSIDDDDLEGFFNRSNQLIRSGLTKYSTSFILNKINVKDFLSNWTDMALHRMNPWIMSSAACYSELNIDLSKYFKQIKS